ncbi:MAG TPA: amino acid adenylation domain-containing protein, partial [Longimicrobium sp.]|nr:amino acid adenylation domain-containing protein [Longimicrobium sp.]
AAFGVELPLRTLFEAPTVAALAARVEAARGGPAPLPAITPAARTDALPLSFAQKRLWMVSRMAADAAYNMPMAFRLRGALDAAALERALGELVRRHEVLRATFTTVDGRPVQATAPAADFHLPVTRLAGLPREEREARVRSHADAEVRHAFDLARGPLFRAALLQLADDEHVLLINLHHIAGDGWSMGVMFRELGALYEAFRRGQPSPLAELPVQYADFAAWQREHLAGEALERPLAWWKAQMDGVPRVLELPADQPRPAVQSFRGAVHALHLGASAAGAVRALARREGATPFMVLLAAFQALLARYTGQHDFVVGSPIAGRTRAETEGMIGFFVNTLPLRADVTGDPTFRTLLGRAREATLGAYAHQELPFEKLVESLGVERDLSRPPLVQVMFSLQNAAGDLALPGLETAAEPSGWASSKFDLSLTLQETEDGFAGCVEYATDLFHAETVARLAAHFATLVEAAADAPDTPVHALPLMDAEERARIVYGWNRTAADFSADTVVARVERRAAERPHAVAVADGARTLTYGELDGAANRLARHLAALGVGAETRVAVCLDRSPELAVALLAVLKAGGAYVPVDPAYPADRIAYLLASSGARVLVSHGALAAALPAHAGATVWLDRDAAAIASRDASPLRTSADPDRLAYVVYTSGSTGTPKGVEIPHRGLANLVDWHLAAFGVGADDMTTLLAGVGFDASAWELWPALSAGATVQVVPPELRTDPAALPGWMAGRGITVSFLPTPLAEAVLAAPWPAGTALRCLLTGGDALRARPAPGLPFRLVNNYGPSECSVVATSGPVESEGAGAPHLGRPIANTRAYVLDAHLHPVAAGVPGELYLGGASLARGYAGRPAATAERFVPDPFGDAAGARLYATGDRVRLRRDGTLQFLGRTDQQVKVRGFRVEPGEVEAALRAHPAVAKCVVVALGTGADVRLAAYVVAAPRAHLHPAELRQEAATRLPAYMVPAHVVPLDVLPL